MSGKITFEQLEEICRIYEVKTIFVSLFVRILKVRNVCMCGGGSNF